VSADLLKLHEALYAHNEVLLGLCSVESYFDDSDALLIWFLKCKQKT